MFSVVPLDAMQFDEQTKVSRVKNAQVSQNEDV